MVGATLTDMTAEPMTDKTSVRVRKYFMDKFIFAAIISL